MKFFKRENKKFEYTPRYYEGDNPYKIKRKLDEFRTSSKKTKGLKNKINKALGELKSDDSVEYEDEVYESNSTFNSKKVILYIAIFLILIFLFIIDFDLSIFQNN